MPDAGKLDENADEITEHDSEAGNLFCRAGYLRALAMRASEWDRLWLLRASRSLLAYAERQRRGALLAVKDKD